MDLGSDSDGGLGWVYVLGSCEWGVFVDELRWGFVVVGTLDLGLLVTAIWVMGSSISVTGWYCYKCGNLARLVLFMGAILMLTDLFQPGPLLF